MNPPPVFAVDHSADTLLAITGTDRAKVLHSFCTNDIKSLAPGQGTEAFITSTQGKTLGHVIVDCQEDRLLLHTVPGQAEKLIKHLDRYIITEDVTLKEVGGEYGQWIVAGEAAAQQLQDAGLQLPQRPLASLRLLDPSPLGPCIVQRVPYLANSFLFTAPREGLTAVADQWAAWQIPVMDDTRLLAGLRIEANWPLFGSDITDDNLPQEIGRDREAISFKKGCYLGQETVARLDALGHVNRILARVRLPADLPAGTEIGHDGKVVGKLTSVGWSPRLSAPIAFALVRVAQAKAGTKLVTSEGEAEVLPP